MPANQQSAPGQPLIQSPGIDIYGPQDVFTSYKPSSRAPQATATPQTTPQQTKADAAIAEIVAPETQLAPSTQAEPQSQEQFEQTVSQMAKTDRAAAKAYYDTWVKKWQ